MSTTTWIIVCTLILAVYTISFLQFLKQRSARKSNQSRVFQLPLFTAFLIGPLLFFLVNMNQRRDRRRFMKDMDRYS
ncbi:hypothetical protein [uncultured Roseivirga sp.]|uniref:hypothetical protein n=1 Tax=uncultured Roseivirga sp. TaxID=543088 RepID=UPI0030DA6F99